MASVVVIGGGAVGLFGALLLARDGHEVTVLERDPVAPPEDPAAAWEEWERRSVNQFRMIHFFLPRFREVAEAEAPDLVQAIEDAGALRLNPITVLPDDLTGGARPDDERFTAITGRRPVVEAAMARVVSSTPGVTIRRGSVVRGLLTGEGADGVAHVVGAVTEQGEEFRADLVVDAGGRRSPVTRWLAEMGGPPPLDEREDCGFVYFGRHFRSDDGSTPFALGPLLQEYDSVSMLTLPADNGTWGLGIVASSTDKAMRALKDVDRWNEVWGSYPLVAHWAEGTPLTGVDVMAGIEDRYRRFVVDGRPVVTGLLAVGDAWACTNPSVGRGVSIGALHAVALRDLLREVELHDPVGAALAWDARTDEVVAPLYRWTLASDRHRLAQMDAQIAGRPYETDDPAWLTKQAVTAASGLDPDLLRAFASSASMLADGVGVFDDPDVRKKALALASDSAPPPGPSRAELVEIVGS